MTALEAAQAAATTLNERLTAQRLGKSMYRQTDHDILAMREAHAALLALSAQETARLRDIEHPEYTPESVVDAAFAGEAFWWSPDTSAPVQSVLVPGLVERVAGNAYRAAVEHLATDQTNRSE